jgi:hypothetical protein
MKPPPTNTLLALLATLILFVGLAVHPSVIVLGAGAVVRLVALLVGFDRRPGRRRH